MKHRLRVFATILLRAFTRFRKHIGQAAFPAILPVKMLSHENTRTTRFTWTLPPKTSDFAILVHLVVFQHGQLHFLLLVFDLLGCGVVLLLPLLATTTKSENQM